MPFTPQFVTKTGGTSPVWKADEQHHIKTKTRPGQNIIDLVFLSGELTFQWGTTEFSWLRDFCEFSFNNLKWDHERGVKVVPVVSLGTIANITTEDTETVGWGVDYVLVEVIPDQNQANTDIIKIKAALAVMGLDSFINRITYSIVAMGVLK